ncbi:MULTISPECIES: glycosyltransferase family 2 protein [Streptosporangium]|uniref:Glycosyltransferase involved in cell wall biosynthesis n=1 Tax=Streptosporangium brasiliense TaxID=47480 RepID=A0ABT9QW36_9ACTN|nr:glycosyltransferase [Streptosporangium brasiliense]MDP9860749.1 glycosyltransferase involved in cell wall biosynthesis [Streptosporangium brasiliense]
MSVVIPAHDCQEALDRTLAGLAAQSYPAHLMEVIVADDGSDPPLRIPGLAPANTRLVRVPDGRWGRGWARQTGAAAAAGDVLHWVDSDMILDREHVEAHMRWHHLASYAVVLGDVRFTPEGVAPLAREIFAAVTAGDAGGLFEGSAPHAWRADLLEETRWLRDAGAAAYRLHSGATTSVPVALLRSVGGVNTALNMGEDTDLGFRLAQAGAVFIPDPQARGWHLGPSTVMLREREVHRHNWSVLPDLIPDLRWLRTHPRRNWLVPYVHVVVDARGASYEDVRASVDSALAGTLVDVAVTVVGPWAALPGGRRSSLDEPLLDMRLVRNLYAYEPRVSFTEETPRSSAPAPFRLTLPAGWALGADSLTELLKLAEGEGYGLLSAVLDGAGEPDEADGPDRADGTGTEVRAVRLERTAAFARAALVGAPDGPDDPDGLVHELFGSFWVSADDFGVTTAGEAEPLGGDPAKWRAGAARWKREAERLEGEVADLRAETERLRAELRQSAEGPQRGPLREIIATAMRQGKAG